MTTKVIALFNHKGGVGKTTTVFHLGWMLANLGKRVLIIDSDPQCNLTGLTLGKGTFDELKKFYDSKGNNDIYSSLAGVFGLDASRIDLKQGVVPSTTGNENLFLLAGHIKFGMLDLQIATAITSSRSLPTLKPLLGSINELIRNTAKIHDVEVVLIDMSPSVSATNMCIFMASDYFIIPTSPDFFCYQAIDSLSELLPRWANELKEFKDDVTLPKINPKMLGLVSQNYHVYESRQNNSQQSLGLEQECDNGKRMASSFKEWADKIKDIVSNKLVKVLKKDNMVIDIEKFQKHVTHDEPYNLANIQDFNSLLPLSQKHSKPMFELTQEDCEKYGATWLRKDKNGKECGLKVSIDIAKEMYNKLAHSVCGLVDLDVDMAVDKRIFDNTIKKASKPLG